MFMTPEMQYTYICIIGFVMKHLSEIYNCIKFYYFKVQYIILIFLLLVKNWLKNLKKYFILKFFVVVALQLIHAQIDSILINCEEYIYIF